MQLDIYMDTDDTTQNNLNITLIGDSYTKEKPLVIRSTNYPQFKTIFNALNIKADYIDPVSTNWWFHQTLI